MGRLHDAAQDGDLKLVKELLTENVDIENADNVLGNTLLHLAAAEGHLSMVIYLLDRGANIHAKTKIPFDYFTPLHLASHEGHLKIVIYLLERGADIHGVPQNASFGYITPLHLAARKGYLEIVKHLIKCGANFNATNDHNNTPLDLARIEEQADVIQFLENYIIQQRNLGAKTKLEDLMSRLDDESFFFTSEEIEDYVQQSANNTNILDLNDINTLEVESDELFFEAAQNGNAETVQRFFARGFNINSKDQWGNMALHWAAIKGHLQIIEFLFSNGAAIDPKDNYQQTPLHWAARNGRLEVVKYLLANGASIHAIAGNGRTPIQFAEQFGQLNVIEYLNEFLQGSN